MMKPCDLKKISDEYMTPAFVFDEDQLSSRVKKIRDILGKDISLCYSIKANPFLIPALVNIVDHFEVCSPGELSICKDNGVPAGMIIYSGVNKGHEDICEALSYGCAILTAESKRHFELINEEAGRLGKKADVILRLTSGNQFGMSDEDIRDILGCGGENVNIIGIHYFAGTGRKKISSHQKELQMLTDMMNDLKKDHPDLSMLEYGPGLPYPYFADEDRSDTLSPLKELYPFLAEASSQFMLSIEMGRFVASECGYYMTRIADIKHSSDTDWCITDGGINHISYLGQMMGMKIPVIMHLKDREDEDGKNVSDYTVCGSLCTTNDVLVRGLGLSDPQIGDVLVFSGIGAYSVTEGLGLFLSRTLPRVIMWHDGKARLVRDFTESWKINTRNTD